MNTYRVIFESTNILPSPHLLSTTCSAMILSDKDNVTSIRRQVNSCLKLLRTYEWLINSFVLDFFYEKHWETLPRCWQEFLADLSPGELADWLDSDDSNHKLSSRPWPLSLLALKQSIKLSP